MAKNWKKPLSITLSPNTQADDVSLALSHILRGDWLNPQWQGKSVSGGQKTTLEEVFKGVFACDYAFSFNAGRAAFLAILEALKLPKNSEIIIQAFTCNAVVNPILKAGLIPIYADIDETLNISIEDLLKKISKKTKAVVIQHTFGYPAKAEEIAEICRKNDILLIEDCAHALGSKSNGKPCGTFGDATFFSFGRDKIISSVFGGIAIVRNPEIGKRLEKIWKRADYPPSSWTLQQLLHPVLMNKLVIPNFENWKIGKALSKIFLAFGWISYSVYPCEAKGKWSENFPKKLPGAVKDLAMNQLKKANALNWHRIRIARIYSSHIKKDGLLKFYTRIPAGCVPLRYSIFTERADEIRNKLKRKGIYLDDGWNNSAIVPPSTDLAKMHYRKWQCPKAEIVAHRILNLPTHINISPQDAKRISKEINDI